jgi:hypothetical protein
VGYVVALVTSGIQEVATTCRDDAGGGFDTEDLMSNLGTRTYAVDGEISPSGVLVALGVDHGDVGAGGLAKPTPHVYAERRNAELDVIDSSNEPSHTAPGNAVEKMLRAALSLSK